MHSLQGFQRFEYSNLLLERTLLGQLTDAGIYMGMFFFFHFFPIVIDCKVIQGLVCGYYWYY